MTALVELHDVTKSFHGVGLPAIAALNVEIDPQARLALVGRSGSGKSTLLNLVAGLEKPTSGEVVWPGLIPPLIPRQIGLAFQGPSLIAWLTVEENVAMPLQLVGEAEWSGRARRCLDILGIADLREKLPDEISGGQAQRVALARAMATEPRLLLADEPTGQLDHQSADLVMSALLSWADRTNCALLVATHDPAIAARLQTVWSLDRGHLLEIPQ
jgi:ABC-type lipoprotein export system ATPase subunit